MINSKWIGIINWDTGITINNIKKENLINNNTSNYKNLKNPNDIINIETYENKSNEIFNINTNKTIYDNKNTDVCKDINDTKDRSNNKDIDDNKDTDDNKDILQNLNYFNFTNSQIPYYNENTEYLNSYSINNQKYNNNYYKLLDRMGNISRFILKGNDYYKLYISKNSNKYLNITEDINDDIKENKLFNALQNDKISKNSKQFSNINIVYQEIETIQYNEDKYNEESL